MSTLGDASRRLVRGRRLRSDSQRSRMSGYVAGPLYASDAVSSVSYAPDLVLLTLAIAGAELLHYSVPVALAVAAVLLVVAASYRQTLRAYPRGGDYMVVRQNLGAGASLVVAGAVLVDYVLVMAVSVAAAVKYVGSVLPWVDGREPLVASLSIVVLTLLALRGWGPRGLRGALPTYLFVLAVTLLLVVGWSRWAFGDLPQAESASYVVGKNVEDYGPLARAWPALLVPLLLLRAFSVGAVSLTGLQTIASAVPRFAPPRARNAAASMLRVALVGAILLVGVVGLARLMGVQLVEDPAYLTIEGRAVPEGFQQTPVLGQIAAGVLDGAPWLADLFTLSVVLVLLVAAMVTFEAFPGLASVLARDGYLPRQMYVRGDRLTFSAGIWVVAITAIVLVLATGAELGLLVQLYVVGVFTAFTLSQLAMVRHWGRQMSGETRRAVEARMIRERVVSATGMVVSGAVLVVLLVTKVQRGAWISLVLIAVTVVFMRGVQRHYRHMSEATAATGSSDESALPSRVHAIVLVARVDKPTLRAISYARGAGPQVLEAVTVDIDPERTRAMLDRWDELDVPIPLRVLDSPYREITRPVLAYVVGIRTERPRDVVAIYLPELVVRRRRERILHNRSAEALKRALLRTPGVMVASVPWVSPD